MKNYVLYHSNCPDGFGAAFAAWLHLPEGTEYLPVNYNQPLPEMEENATVYILDFSYSRNILIGLARRMYRVVVLDHHKTAQEDLRDLKLDGFDSFVSFDMEESGATMSWKFFHDQGPMASVPEFFQYLRDRDLWQWKLPMSKEVSYAVRSYPMDFMTWTQISGIVPFGQIYEMPGICIDNLKKEGVALRRLTETQVDIMAKNHRWASFHLETKSIDFWNTVPASNGNVFIGPVANASINFSEVADRLIELTGNNFAAYYFDRKDGTRQWGLRSKPEVDCSVIARAFGGGGHATAAGFQTVLPC